MTRSRKVIIKKLLEYTYPLSLIKEELGFFGWDSEELVVLLPTHIKNVLKRFLDGELSSHEVEEWANLIEGRDDIGFGSDRTESLVGEAIHQLANPLLTENLSYSSANKLLEQLEDSV